MAYRPRPIATSKTPLPPGLEALAERLAKNAHDLWAQERLAQGWAYGPRRNDRRKTHPCLVPYRELPEAEKVFDRQAAMGTVRAILSLGYRIRKA
jgi:hypothetical protein